MTAMVGWKTGNLGSLCTIEIGGTPSRSNPDYWDNAKETKNRWVSIRDLHGRVVSDTSEHITDIGCRNSNVKLQKSGTVLLSFKLSIGRVAFAGCDLYTNEAIAGLCSEELDSEFLFYGLQQWDLLQNVDQAIKGATLNKEKLKQIEFVYPVLPEEQTQIATILSTLDRAIEQTEAIIAKQQRINAGLMQDLLTKGIDEHGVIRSETTHMFKDSSLGRIPVEWEGKTLDSCVRPDSPICYGILMPGTGFDNGVPVIKVKDIFDGRICQNALLLTDPKIDQAYKRSRLNESDLLMTIRGTTGRIAIVPKTLDRANITQDTARIRLRPEHSNVFFYFLMHSRKVQDQIMLHTLGQAVKGINIAEVRRLIFALPEKAEQERISTTLTHANNLWEAAIESLSKLQRQKAGLMHDLLTGKVRVKPEAVSS
jgi:type I restriction enzyme, S subunit